MTLNFHVDHQGGGRTDHGTLNFQPSGPGGGTFSVETHHLGHEPGTNGSWDYTLQGTALTGHISTVNMRLTDGGDTSKPHIHYHQMTGIVGGLDSSGNFNNVTMGQLVFNSSHRDHPIESSDVWDASASEAEEEHHHHGHRHGANG